MKENDVFAFPLPEFSNVDGRQGMTLRDYFAGQALIYHANWGSEHAEQAARVCYALADAMLTERGKE